MFQNKTYLRHLFTKISRKIFVRINAKLGKYLKINEFKDNKNRIFLKDDI